MQFIVLFTVIMFFSLWAILAAYLTGFIPVELVPQNIKILTLPKSTTDLGDSLAILDGMFTSIAIVLGLIAILLQGKELKESTKAQTEQAKSLEIQILQQQASNQLGAYTARLQFLLAEADRLGNQADKLHTEVTERGENEGGSEKWNIIKSSRSLQIQHRKDVKGIDSKIKQLLPIS